MTDADNHGKTVLAMLTSQAIEPVFWTPRLLDQPSGWWGHVPFAFWLTATMRPRVLVELGTYRGISYSVFCEAVIKSCIDTRCWAVDTWEGDAHVGRYGSEVYEKFKLFHDQNYGSFSQLMKMEFDEACSQFQDGAIDLLHIDGYHTYEAVRHDFETWRAKLSERAVVLFHDTNNNLKADIGVKQFLSELGNSVPTFEFPHSFGLGVAAVGEEVPAALKELFETTDAGRVSMLRERFAHLGALWEKEDLAEQLRQGASYQQSLEREIERKDKELLNAQEAYNALMDELGRQMTKS